jgi:precorrin-2 dehydrogenase/sirohydrochlorin ferrochelatase
MIPVMLDLSRVRVALAGKGSAMMRRLTMLEEGGASNLPVYVAASDDPPSDDPAASVAGRHRRLPVAADLKHIDILFVAGLDAPMAEELARLARREGVLVHIEDRKDLCDLHFPSVLRRGDLMISVSTGGHAPGLARRLRQALGQWIGPEWGLRLDELASRRQRWRERGLGTADLTRLTDRWIDRHGWLQNLPKKR